MQAPDTYITMTTLWGQRYREALVRAAEELKERFPDRKPSVILLHPDAPEIEIPEGMKVIRKRSTPLGEVWVG